MKNESDHRPGEAESGTLPRPNYINEVPENHPTNRFPRTMGVIILAIGAGLAKWQIYDPLHVAEQARHEVWISSELIGLAIFFGVYGLALILFGRKPNQWLRIDPKHVDWKNAIFLVVMGLVCLAVYLWVQMQLSAQGYRR